MVRIRQARPDEAEALSALALRSKGYWGYDQAFLDACRGEPAIAPHEIGPHRISVAEDDADEVLGLASLEGSAPVGALGMMFVEPRAIGRGIGRALYAHVLATARELGFTRLTIDADPNAEPFYRAMGARLIGTTSSGSIPGRELPLLDVLITP
jgi:GNAT superfamily N-acetyltransferase